MEELIDMLLELSSFRRVLSGKQKRLFKLTPHGGSLFVYLHLVPALLQEIGAVIIASVCIAERDMLDIVVWLFEGILYHVRV